MSDSKKDKTEEGVIAVEQSLSKVEQFIEDNQKNLLIAVAILAVIVLGYIGYKKLYLAPLEAEASEQMFAAEQYFQMDSINKAINGDGNALGFKEVADEYGSTKAGNLANYYLGVCYMHKGDFKNALESLNDFSANDEVLGTLALGLQGDAHLELNEKDDALAFYDKAVKRKPNAFVTPTYLFKKGILLEDMGKFQDAVDTYTKIKTDYKESLQARQIDKYIAHAQVLAQK